MTEYTVDPCKPNVLLVLGDDIVGGDVEFRDRLRGFIDAQNKYPVSRGSHDSWVTYRVPMPAGDMVSNHSREDMGLTPRPMRGVI